jgi:hypothetical protein
MKLNNLVLPHPVLGQADDIIGICKFKNDPTIEINDDCYQVEFEIEHDNGTIADLVKNEKAIYCCEISCNGTLYRDIFHSKETSFKIEIPRISVRNKVNFQVFCLTIKELFNYNNAAAHTDFDGFSFDLEKADLLAIFGTFYFDAEIQYHKLKAASSFMQIVPNDAGKTLTEYILDDSKIQIKLPEASYEKYKYFSKKKIFAPIIHASIVQNALTVALFNLNEHIEIGNVWARSIKYRLENEPELNNGSSQIDPNNIPELVQKLLGNPNERLIERLDEMSNGNDNEEN